MEAVLDTYELPYNADFPVVCVDESPKQIIDYKEFRGNDGTQYQDCEYVRLGVAELFVAFEPLAGWREMSVEDDHKAATWVKFIANLLDNRYKDATRVTCVLDNFSAHRDHHFYSVFSPEKAKSYLDRTQFVYTPVHGSWLNMAEIQFSVLSRQALNKPFKDKEAVKKVVEQWVQTQNEQKRGAKWQFTNKEARVKLCKLYPTN